MVKSIINVKRSSIWRGRKGTDNGRQKTEGIDYGVLKRV